MAGPDVLIVDDDPDIRTMLGVTLGREFSVRFASSGQAAIEALTHNPPAAVLLDIMMPGTDGYDVLEVRRERRLAPDTCIVMLTAKTEERDLVRSWALGADAYLTKPVDPEVIAQKLRTHIVTAPA